MSDHTTTDALSPGPADVYCPRCGRYHAPITCCPPLDHARCRTVPAAATNANPFVLDQYLEVQKYE